MKRVLEIFYDICKIPHGSGNMEAISRFCLDFALSLGLKAVRDEALNVIITKEASPGREGEEGIILQGHMDMVCQKEDGLSIDFDTDPIRPVIEGDLLRARGTSLGADNGVAVALILAILERNDLSHPHLEAILTTDEETGMIGAGKLDMTGIRGKKLVNLDSEEENVITVSCAGGSDFQAFLPLEREEKQGFPVNLTIRGLQGGHSGMAIHHGRENANILAGQILKNLAEKVDFELIGIAGGDKTNAITPAATVRMLVSDWDAFLCAAKPILLQKKREMREREPGLVFDLEWEEGQEESVIDKPTASFLIEILSSVPDGVVAMSPDIPDLVETSLNLGILETKEDSVLLHHLLRSNQRAALTDLEEELKKFYAPYRAKIHTFGHYPAWEYRKDSSLRETWRSLYRETCGEEIRVMAIHAGLECGVFLKKKEDLDCIAIGPNIYDVHTVKERMELSSLEKVYSLVKKLLAKKM